MSRSEDNHHAKLAADPSDILTDPFCVGSITEGLSSSCNGGASSVSSTRLKGLEEKRMKVLGYWFYLRTLVRWRSSLHKLFCSVVTVLALSNKYLTSPLLTCGWVVGVEVQVPVHVCWFPVDGDVQAAIILPLEQGVKNGESSAFPHLHSEPDGWSQGGSDVLPLCPSSQYSRCHQHISSKGCMELCRGSHECQFLKELHVQVCHHSRDR